MPLDENDRKALTCDPSDYDHKYTIQATENSWLMVYYYEPIDRDVEILVQNLEDFDRHNRVFEYQRHLLSLRSNYIHLPEKVFNWSGELWFIFPQCVGRTLDEVLARHHRGGLPNERITGRILLDVLEALEELHKAKLCHRALSPHNLLIEKSTGVTKLKDFTNLKSFEEDVKAKKKRPKLPLAQQRHLKPPELLGLCGDEKEKEVDESKVDIFLFAITAMTLAYGKAPPSPFPKNVKVESTDWESPSPKFYPVQPEQISPAFKEMIAPCLARSTSDRPTVQELKKAKFFNKVASRDELKVQICRLLKLEEPSQEHALPHLPPSQRKDCNMGHSTTNRSHWDFGDSMRHESAPDLEESKDTRLTLDDISEQDSARNVAHRQMYPKNNQGPMSPNTAIAMDNEDLKDGDHLHGQRGRDLGRTRFRVQDVQYEDRQDSSTALTLDGFPATERKEKSKSAEDSSTKSATRFHVTDARNIGTRADAGDSYLSMPAPRNHPIKKIVSAPLKTSRFKVEEVQVEGTVQGVGLAAAISKTTVSNLSTAGIAGSAVMKSKIASYKENPPNQWKVEDVCEWLESLGGDFKDYTSFFKEAGIDGEMLHNLNAEELEELQVKKKIHRRRVLTSIKKLSWS